MFNENQINKLDKVTHIAMIIALSICLIVPFFSKLQYNRNDYLYIIAPIIGFFGGQKISNYYRYKRNEQKIADVIQGLTEILIYPFILCVLSYCAAYTGFELKTELMVKIDSILGFNWLQVYNNSLQHPILERVLFFAYSSMIPQCILATIIFSLFGNRAWLRIFINAFIILGIITILITVIVPAAEADGFFGVTQVVLINGYWTSDVPQASHFLNLNKQLLHEIPLSNLAGLVTFPSFHAMTGIILTVCFYQIKWLRYPALILNSVLIAATPTVGGHYLVDTLAGAMIALLGMSAILKYVQPTEPLFSFRMPLSVKHTHKQYVATLNN